MNLQEVLNGKAYLCDANLLRFSLACTYGSSGLLKAYPGGLQVS